MSRVVNRSDHSMQQFGNSDVAIASPPLVSVIIPAYNVEALIDRTLTSVLAQTYRNLQVIVVDDGSTDQTAAIVDRIARSDSRVTLLQQVHAGAAAARNKGILHAKGEFIAPLDADDIWFPENIEKQVLTFLNSDASVGVIYSWSLDIDEADRPQAGFAASSIEGNVYLTLICHYFMGNSSCALIRRTCLDRVGNYNTDMFRLEAAGCEDWDLCLRIAEFYDYRVVPEFLVGYRKSRESMTRDYATMARSHDWMLQFARRRNPNISPILCRFSDSSFYLYLARQTNRNGDYRGTIHWLRMAITSDPVTPFLRLRLYSLILSVCTQAVTERLHVSKREPTRNRDRIDQYSCSQASVAPHVPTIKQRIAIRVVAGIVRVFHRLAPILFRASRI